MEGVRTWVVGVVWATCLVTNARGQLGVQVVDRHTETPVISTTTTTTTMLLPPPRGQGKVQEGEREASLRTGRRGEWWQRLPDTYQGCYHEDTLQLDGSLIVVNLTQVMEINELGSVQHACFHMCLTWRPFSNYTAISPTLTSGTDACGCLGLLDTSNKTEDNTCDQLEEHYRVYCGPNNIDCLNHGALLLPSPGFLFLVLVTLLIFSTQKDVYS